ncbi:MAG: DUF4928 family protein [Pirellulales bacterium]|nr:DUF4928 family protein [Pirellulales bacterium]
MTRRSPRNPLLKPLAEWLDSCTRKRKISRNTLAVGIVILNHLRNKCPLESADVLSSGGEIMGSRYGLAETLGSYGLPADKFLKEVTTRQAHQDGQRLLAALDFGRGLVNLHGDQRDSFLQQAIEKLVVLAREWLGRQHLKIGCDPHMAPDAWVASILGEARGRSGGKVEQHLVGATLEHRHPNVAVPNFAGHAADVQTGRGGDFLIGTTCYHVTASPGSDVVRKCAANLGAGLYPVLLVPRNEVGRARHLAEDQGVDVRFTIAAIEDFIALNIIEMADGEQPRFIELLRTIVETYNRRLQEVETDMSLRIEVQ